MKKNKKLQTIALLSSIFFLVCGVLNVKPDVADAQAAWTFEAMVFRNGVGINPKFQANANFNIMPGDRVNLEWTAMNSASCYDNGQNSNFDVPNDINHGSVTVDAPPNGESRTYTVTCTGGGSKSFTISTSGGNAEVPPTPSIFMGEDCVYNYPQTFAIYLDEPQNDRYRIEFSGDKNNNSSTLYPSASTYYPSNSQQNYINHIFTYHDPNGVGGYVSPTARAIDEKGNASEWTHNDYLSDGYSLYRKCVNNLDEGLSGADSDGTDLVVTVNGAVRSASNISITTGDEVSFQWRSALDNCTSYAGLMVWQTAGTQSNITEPAPGQSATFNVHCNTIGFEQSETIIVTNGSAQPPVVPPPPTSGSVTANVRATINNTLQDASYVQMYPGDTIQTVNWVQSGATSCTLSGSNGVSKTSNRTSDNVPGTAPYTGSYDTYDLTCTGPTGSASDSILIEMIDPTPPPPPSPQVYLSSTINSGSPNTSSATIYINEGDQVVLGWSSSAVSSCIGTNFNTSGAASGGGAAITEPSANTQQTYSISCPSDYGYPAATDAVTVVNRGVNNVPTPPTVTGTTTGYTSVTHTFQVTGSTDANGDNLTYYVDWDNNGSYDTYSSPPRNPVGYTYTPSRSWSSAGAKTFCVWANDGRGGVSTKTCHTITVSVPPPPVLNLTVNGSSGPVNVHYNDNMTIAWTVSRSMSCTLTGAGVNGWAGSASVGSSGSMVIDTDYISSTGTGDETYVLSCGGYTDSIYVDAISNALSFEVQENSNPWSMNSITVASNSTIRLRWNYTDWGNCSGTNFNTGGSKSHAGLVVTTPSAGQSRTYTISCGFTPYRASLTVTSARSNFTTPIVNTPTFGTFSTTTNQYNNISLIFRTENNDGSPTPANADYRFEFDLGNNGTYETVVNRTNALESLAPGAGTNKTEQVTNVPPGVHRVRITVDSGNEATESNETDNVYTGTITIPAQDPGVSITTNRPQVRKDDTAVITWTITNPNPTLSCVVSGPGLTPQTYTASGNLTTPPITAKSEYSLRCTDSATGTVWAKTVTVETTGTVEEV